MAGIGFELKKIFTKGGVFNSIKGAFYASLTTIGPMIMIITALLSMYVVLDYSSLSFARRDLMSSTVLYIFIFSLITTSPFNSVLSRYIADKIYEEKFDDILPSFYSGLFINIIVTSLFGIPFCVRLFFVGEVDLLYILAAYCMYIALAFSFYTMTYISALKEYKKISFSFLIGLGIAFVLAFLMVRVWGLPLDEAIIYSFAVGFLIIATILFSLIKSYFRKSSGNYRETFTYFRKYKGLFFVNLFYTLGLYAHNFVFWQDKSLQLVVADSFVSAPIYDLATCIAMFINISTMVIFVVQVETDFHERYVAYCEAIIGGTHEDILQCKSDMLDTMRYKLTFIFQLQMLINILLYLAVVIFLPRMGISGPVVEMLPSLAVGYFAVFIMYCIIVFMYYFEDVKGALITAALFFSISTILTIVIMLIKLQPSLYGTGLFIGALASFGYGYYRIRRVEGELEKHIFCRGTIIPKGNLSEIQGSK